jgi:thiamine-monophosphate kinase
MDEFAIIDTFFKSLKSTRTDVLFGIGDDAACMQLAPGLELLVTTDTLVSGVHFLPTWDAYDIAYKAVMVNVSDIAAMAGNPCWATLALTLPAQDLTWLTRFSAGLGDALGLFDIALVGGDTTRGPLSMTLTMHGTVPLGQAIRRSGASASDLIYVSGPLGAASLAVEWLHERPTHPDLDESNYAVLLNCLKHPYPRVDLVPYLRQYASAAIDISDGLAADLNHLCAESHVGACLDLSRIPLHTQVSQYFQAGLLNPLDFALHGGDDYELCFTIPLALNDSFLRDMTHAGIACHQVGVIESALGLRQKTVSGLCLDLSPRGYQHF